MAYRPFYGAPYLYCWGAGTHVCVQELDGRVSRYECNLRFSTEKQLNPFHGPDAVWCLKHNGVLFVGRNDSTFSGFRESDGLLVRYGPWSYPFRRTFECVGTYGPYTAAIDSADMRTVYVFDPKKAYVLKEPLQEGSVLPPALCHAVRGKMELSIYTERGMLDVKKAGAWVDAPELPWGSTPVQL